VTAAAPPARRRLLPVVMFLSSFSWSFVYVSLPFHVQAISTWDAASTLRWTGWILGVTSISTVVMSPLWGRLADRGDPRALYLAIEVFQGLAFFGMVAARTLPELLLARLVLGSMGASSTFAFVMAGAAGDEREARRGIAGIQSAMTVGQVVGPLAGAVAARSLGFRASFGLGGVILLGCAALVRWGIPSAPPRRPADPVARRTAWRQVAAVALLSLGGSTQVFFLTAILPQVVPTLGVPDARALEVGGLLIFASGAAAALGSLAAARVSQLAPEGRLIPALFVGSSVCVAALGLAGSPWSYGLVRFLQVLLIAPVFPLVVARVAHVAGGAAIGVINSARIGAAFVGPVLATSLLTWTSPAVLYLALAAVGLACLPLARLDPHRRPVS
jgi:MFS family permease